MAMMRWLEVGVGLYYFIFGFDGFFKKIPLPQPSENAIIFLKTLESSKYILFTVKVVEILVGASWILGIGSGLSWILLTPIWFNIVGYHFFVNKREKYLPLVLVASNIFLGY